MFKFWKKKPAQVEVKLEDEKSKEKGATPDWGDPKGSAEKLKYIQENATQQQAPTPKSKSAMDSCDTSAQYQPDFSYVNQHVLSYFVASSSFIGYHACALIAQNGLVERACSLKVSDAVKNWYDVAIGDGTALDERQIKYIEKMDKKFKLKQNMKEAVTFNNTFGVRHVLFKHKDKNFNYELPFNPDSFKEGDYAGMAQIDPYWLLPVISDEDLNNPAAIGYYEPTYWELAGKRYHKSHFVILTGGKVADYLKPTYRYGGISLVQRIYERLYASERTANEAPQLAMSKRLQIRKTDLEKAQANKAQFKKNLAVSNEFRDNFQTQVVGLNEDINQIDTSLADLDNVIMSQFQLFCSISGYTSTKLLGTSPNGFSSGDTENDSYLESVEQLQGDELDEIAQAHYARLIPSNLTKKLGVKDLEIEINWRPLKIMSELELSTVRVNNSTADTNSYNSGAVDNIDIRQRLVNDKSSGFSGMSMPDEIDNEYDESVDPSQSLNGAQVTSMMNITEKVSMGEMSKETASALMATSFPMTKEQADKLVSNVIIRSGAVGVD